MSDEKPCFVSTIAQSYKNGESSGNIANVRECYRNLATVNEQLFDEIDIPVYFQAQDPYENYEDMKKTVETTDELRIFSGGSHPTHLTRMENLQSRAVHDYHGHLGYDTDFTIEGEFMKWWNMAQCEYPDTLHQLTFAEVVGQVCVVHYSGWDYEQQPVISPSEHIELVCNYYDKSVPSGYDYW